MINTLVLMRHGNPDYSMDVDDLDRQLTPAGLRALEDVMPHELALLGDPQDITIWSSPATRARQTAEVVCHALRMSESNIKTCNALYKQDQEAFLEQMESVEGTAIAVGHVPFMEEMFGRFSGGSLRFGKGSAACFSFPSGTFSKAELRWYVQGPDSSNWETLIHVEEGLADVAMQIEDRAEALLADPENSAALHDFRVAIRRARALLAFVRPFQKRRQSLSTDMVLSDLQHASSFLRELDGMCGRSERAGKSMADGLYAVCSTAREEERTRFIGYLRRRDTQRLLREACHGLRNTRWRATTEMEGLSREEFQAEYDELRTGVIDQFLVCNFMDDEDTHIVRKRVKRLRYVADGYAELLNERQEASVEAARRLQSELGHLCDVRVDRDIVDVLGRRGAISREDPTVVSFLEECQVKEEACIQHLQKLRVSMEDGD